MGFLKPFIGKFESAIDFAEKILPFASLFYLAETVFFTVLLTAFAPKSAVFIISVILVSLAGCLSVSLFFRGKRAYSVILFVMDFHIPFSLFAFLTSVLSRSGLVFSSARLCFAFFELFLFIVLTRPERNRTI